MKKVRVAILLIIILSLSACSLLNKNNPTNQTSTSLSTKENTSPETGEETKVETESTETKTSETTSATKISETTSATEELSIENYFIFHNNTLLQYAGEGIEYASYVSYVDYTDDTNKRVQQRVNNSGSETVSVYELSNDEIALVYQAPAVYYRDNYLKAKGLDMSRDILLQEPLKVGHSWSSIDGDRREIIATDAPFEFQKELYQCILVRTTYADSTTDDYYAKDLGHVQTVTTLNDGYIVKSRLEEMQEDTPWIIYLNFYSPNLDAEVESYPKELSFYTNDVSRIVLQEALKEMTSDANLIALISENTKINSMYLNQDGAAYIDLSQEFISEMNLGSGFEAARLQALVDTIGYYYGTDRIYLTIENEPYQSGHLYFKKGEFLKVSEDVFP